MQVFDFSTRAKQNFPKWVAQGIALPNDSTAPQPECTKCGRLMIRTPFKRYGVLFQGHFEFTCDCENEQTAISTIVSPESTADQRTRVILVYGIALRITPDEARMYLQAAQQGRKMFVIRDYVLDRLYPIIPVEEYEKQMDKRYRRDD